MNQSILETYKQKSKKFLLQIFATEAGLVIFICFMLFLNHNTAAENLITIGMFVWIVVLLFVLIGVIKHFKDKKSTAILRNMDDATLNKLENDYQTGPKLENCTLAGDYFVSIAPNDLTVLPMKDITNVHILRVRQMYLFIPMGSSYFLVLTQGKKTKNIPFKKKLKPQFEEFAVEMARRYPHVSLGKE